jgi:signal transduction histidine kinase
MAAAAALPREMEGCLAHMDSLSDALFAIFDGDQQAKEIGKSLKAEVERLRTLSRRLRLYSELPSLYARRFSSANETARCSVETAVAAAHSKATQWSRGGDLEVRASGTSIPLPTEAVEVIVTELVDNACKFSRASTPVGMEISSNQACWNIEVTDHGEGINAQQIREVGAFKQFWSGAERPCGLGIGLVLVQTLVRLHGGEVQVESEPGERTRVRIMVPAE